MRARKSRTGPKECFIACSARAAADQPRVSRCGALPPVRPRIAQATPRPRAGRRTQGSGRRQVRAALLPPAGGPAAWPLPGPPGCLQVGSQDAQRRGRRSLRDLSAHFAPRARVPSRVGVRAGLWRQARLGRPPPVEQPEALGGRAERRAPPPGWVRDRRRSLAGPWARDCGLGHGAQRALARRLTPGLGPEPVQPVPAQAAERGPREGPPPPAAARGGRPADRGRRGGCRRHGPRSAGGPARLISFPRCRPLLSGRLLQPIHLRGPRPRRGADRRCRSRRGCECSRSDPTSRPCPRNGRCRRLPRPRATQCGPLCRCRGAGHSRRDRRRSNTA